MGLDNPVDHTQLMDIALNMRGGLIHCPPGQQLLSNRFFILLKITILTTQNSDIIFSLNH